MERVMEEGTVATANTLSKMLSYMPSCGKPTRIMVYDLHTLQVPNVHVTPCLTPCSHAAAPLRTAST